MKLLFFSFFILSIFCMEFDEIYSSSEKQIYDAKLSENGLHLVTLEYEKTALRFQVSVRRRTRPTLRSRFADEPATIMTYSKGKEDGVAKYGFVDVSADGRLVAVTLGPRRDCPTGSLRLFRRDADSNGDSFWISLILTRTECDPSLFPDGEQRSFGGPVAIAGHSSVLAVATCPVAAPGCHPKLIYLIPQDGASLQEMSPLATVQADQFTFPGNALTLLEPSIPQLAVAPGLHPTAGAIGYHLAEEELGRRLFTSVTFDLPIVEDSPFYGPELSKGFLFKPNRNVDTSLLSLPPVISFPNSSEYYVSFPAAQSSVDRHGTDAAWTPFPVRDRVVAMSSSSTGYLLVAYQKKQACAPAVRAVFTLELFAVSALAMTSVRRFSPTGLADGAQIVQLSMHGDAKESTVFVHSRNGLREERIQVFSMTSADDAVDCPSATEPPEITNTEEQTTTTIISTTMNVSDTDSPSSSSSSSLLIPLLIGAGAGLCALLCVGVTFILVRARRQRTSKSSSLAASLHHYGAGTAGGSSSRRRTRTSTSGASAHPPSSLDRRSSRTSVHRMRKNHRVSATTPSSLSPPNNDVHHQTQPSGSSEYAVVAASDLLHAARRPPYSSFGLNASGANSYESFSTPLQDQKQKQQQPNDYEQIYSVFQT